MVKISSKVSKLFFDIIKRKKQNDRLLADIIMRISNLGYNVKPIYTEGLPRIEIDFESDLIEANNIFVQKKENRKK